MESFLTLRIEDLLQSPTVELILDTSKLESNKKSYQDVLALSPYDAWILDKLKFGYLVGAIDWMSKWDKDAYEKYRSTCRDLMAFILESYDRWIHRNDTFKCQVLQRLLWSQSQLLAICNKMCGMNKGGSQEIDRTWISNHLKIYLTQNTLWILNGLEKAIDHVIYTNELLIQCLPIILDWELHPNEMADYIGQLSDHSIFDTPMITFMEALLRIAQCKKKRLIYITKLLVVLRPYYRGSTLLSTTNIIKIQTCLERKECKTANKFLKILSAADAKLSHDSCKYLHQHFHALWNMTNYGDNAFVKVVLSTILTTIKIGVIGENMAHIILQLSRLKDAHLRAKAIELYPSLFRQHALHEMLLRSIAKSLRDPSKKVKVGAAKALLAMIDHQEINASWYQGKVEELGIQTIIRHLITIPSFAPEFHKDLCDVTKKIVLQYIQLGIIDVNTLLKHLSSQIEDVHTTNLVSDIFMAKITPMETHEGLLWWCEFVNAHRLSELFIYERILSRINHPTISIHQYYDSQIYHRFKESVLKLSCLLYEKNDVFLSNYAFKLIEMIPTHLSNKPLLEAILHLMLKVTLTEEASTQLSLLLLDRDVLKPLLISDITRVLTLKLMFKILKTPRTHLFRFLESTLQEAVQSGNMITFIKLLKDSILENSAYIAYITQSHVEEEKANVKDIADRILDYDLVHSYFGRFIDMVVYGVTCETMAMDLRMMCLLCLGVYMYFSSTLSKEHFPSLALRLRTPNTIDELYILSAVIGADMIRTLPNEAKHMVNFLFDSLEYENSNQNVEKLQFVTLSLIERLHSERMIKVEDKIYKVLYLRDHSHLSGISGRITQKYLNQSALAGRTSYHLCMSILSDKTISLEKARAYVATIIQDQLKPGIQRELSSLILKSILTRLKTGHTDALLESKLFLNSLLRTSKISKNLMKLIQKELEEKKQGLDGYILETIKSQLSGDP